MRGGEEKTWRGEKKGAELDEKERRQIGGVWGDPFGKIKGGKRDIQLMCSDLIYQ